jgi:hypothetical protein
MIRMYEGYEKVSYSSVPMDGTFDLAYSSNFWKWQTLPNFFEI